MINFQQNSLAICLAFFLCSSGNSWGHRFHAHDSGLQQVQATKERVLKQRLSAAPNNPYHSMRLMQFYIDAGNRSTHGRYFDQGIEVYNRLLAAPYVPERAYLLGAYLLQKTHRFDGALIALQQYIVRVPRDKSAWLMKSQIELTIGEHNAAKNSCKTLARLDAIELAQTCASAVWTMQGEPGRAFTQMRKLLREKHAGSNQHTAIHSAYRAWQWEVFTDIANQLGEAKTIHRLYQRAIKEFPANQYLRINYADFLLEQNLTKQAHRVLRRSPWTEPVLLRLARVRHHMQSRYQRRRLERALKKFVRNSRRTVDPGHHRELSYYFLYIRRDYRRALTSAQLNWQLQKELIDRRLLDAARSRRE